MDRQRDVGNDALTVTDWLEGVYPNFFFSVGIGEIDRFTARYGALRHRDELEALIGMCGIRRSNSGCWETADWFKDRYLREKPVQAGLFDLNRYSAWHWRGRGLAGRPPGSQLR